jgi:hypothetical protein
MVATAAQIAANRANARRSTGPRTPEGKAVSSRNALTHGAYAADDTILATAADTYLDDFRAHFQPANPFEEHLVAHLAALAGRRDRLNAAMDALLELNERHALTEHLHERYGVNHPNGHIPGQPSWQAAMRRYDDNTYVDPRRPELVSDPSLDPDPILCSLAYTLSGPRAAAIARHEASVDRRFHATLKELTTLQAQRRAAAIAATPPAVSPHEPRLQRALDRYLRATATPAEPWFDPLARSTAASPAHGTAAPPPDPVPSRPTSTAGSIPPPVSGRQASLPDQSQSARPEPQSSTQAEQNEPGVASAQKEANAPAATLAFENRAPQPSQPAAAGVVPAIRPRSRASIHPGIEPNPAGYVPDDEPVFLSVLPRDPDEPSSIPAHWPGAFLPEQ